MPPRLIQVTEPHKSGLIVVTILHSPRHLRHDDRLPIRDRGLRPVPGRHLRRGTGTCCPRAENVPVSLPVGRVAPVCGAEDGEESDQEQTDGGETGAYDADAYLDRRPEAHVVELPCPVQGLGEVDEGLEAYDADDGDTGTHVG